MKRAWPDGGVCSEIEGKSVLAGKEGRDRVKESFRYQRAGLGLLLRAVQRVEKDTMSQIYIDRGWRGSAGLGIQLCFMGCFRRRSGSGKLHAIVST